MTAVPRQIRRKAARRPAPRTVTVTVEKGDFEGWEATARADFPAEWLKPLDSADIGQVMGVLERIILDHNMPDSDDEIATSLADVDPYRGLVEIAGLIMDAIVKLPNR